MEKLRKDMEKTGGETVVLSTGLKDKEGKNKDLMDEENEDEEEEDVDGFERFSEEDEDIIDEDDEEVGRFSF